MKVLNIHERTLARPLAEAAFLIDRLASQVDALWPRSCWPRMRLAPGLVPGAEGGHGPIGYRVEAWAPGRSAAFAFTRPRGFRGGHRFDLQAEGEGACRLRHTLEMEARGLSALAWLLAIRWLHDALLEDALAQAEGSLGLPPRLRPWSPWVRLLRWAMGGGRRVRQGIALPGQAT